MGSTPMPRMTSAGISVTSRRAMQRHADVQQAVHDLGARVGADRGRGQAAREQADGEQRRDDRADARAERRVRALERVGARDAREVRRGEQQDAEVHGARDEHRDDDVPPGRAQQAGGRDAAQLFERGSMRARSSRARAWSRRWPWSTARVGRAADRGEPVARERAVRVDRVRHDRRAEDGCRQQHRPGALEAGDQARRRPQPASGGRDEHAEREADRDDRDQSDDDELERARAAPGLHHEQHDRDGARDDAAPQQRDAEQQVERDRTADDLGDVGRHRDELGLQPVGAAGPADCGCGRPASRAGSCR